LLIFKLTPNTQNTTNPHDIFLNALWNVSCQMVPAQDNWSEVRHIYLPLAQSLSKNGTNFPFNPTVITSDYFPAQNVPFDFSIGEAVIYRAVETEL
jgi:hypothetical protein